MKIRVNKEEREPSQHMGKPRSLCAQDNPTRRKEYILRCPHIILGFGLTLLNTPAKLIKHFLLHGQSEKMQIEARCIMWGKFSLSAGVLKYFILLSISVFLTGSREVFSRLPGPAFSIPAITALTLEAVSSSPSAFTTYCPLIFLPYLHGSSLKIVL